MIITVRIDDIDKENIEKIINLYSKMYPRKRKITKSDVIREAISELAYMYQEEFTTSIAKRNK